MSVVFRFSFFLFFSRIFRRRINSVVVGYGIVTRMSVPLHRTGGVEGGISGETRRRVENLGGRGRGGAAWGFRHERSGGEDSHRKVSCR